MTLPYRMREQPEYTATAREVVKVLNDVPHLVVRIDVRGTQFPYRAAHPFVIIQTREDADGYIKDWFTDIAPDQQALIAYFPVTLPPTGVVMFGYADEVWGTVAVKFEEKTVTRLDKERLPEKLVIVDEEFFRRQQGGKSGRELE